MIRSFALAQVAALTVSSTAVGQTPPWRGAPSRAPVGGPAGVRVEPGVPVAARWPAPQRVRVRRAIPLPRLRVRAPERDPDPGAGGYFQMPTARVLRYGDLAGTYLSALGWVGVRYGVTRNIDVGVGVPFYFAGLSVDLRVVFAEGRGVTAAWWGYATVPFVGEGERASSSLGFTWSFAGLGWLTGPLVTFAGGRVTANFGVHIAQRTGLGGLWALSHATLAVRIIDGVKALAQGLALYEVVEERAPRADALLGNGAPRLIPYGLAGVRLYTRRFAADLGALVPLSADAPLHSEQIPVLPWIALQHTF